MEHDNGTLKVGDIVRPIDGSGMPEPLDKYLSSPEISGDYRFGTVRVLDIQGDLIAVMPTTLSRSDIAYRDDYADLLKCLQWIDQPGNLHSEEGFWIYRRFKPEDNGHRQMAIERL